MLHFSPLCGDGRLVLVQIGKGDNWQLPYCPKMELLVIGPIIHPTLDLQPGRFPDVFFILNFGPIIHPTLDLHLLQTTQKIS